MGKKVHVRNIWYTITWGSEHITHWFEVLGMGWCEENAGYSIREAGPDHFCGNLLPRKRERDWFELEWNMTDQERAKGHWR